jgi:hypothetical protein
MKENYKTLSESLDMIGKVITVKMKKQQFHSATECLTDISDLIFRVNELLEDDNLTVDECNKIIQKHKDKILMLEQIYIKNNYVDSEFSNKINELKNDYNI